MWARSEAGLSRLPVTEKIAGSNPVGPAKKAPHLTMGFFLCSAKAHPTTRHLHIQYAEK